MDNVLLSEHKYSRTGEELNECLAYETLPFLINWTGAIAEHPDRVVLNEKSRTDKLAQLIRLGLAGVSTPRWHYKPVLGWLPRTSLHQQGMDFTQKVENPDFWVEPIPADDEWRLHFFRTNKGNMRLLRSGLKLPKNKKFHPWVRSHRLGWKISYVGGAPPQVVEQARKAMQALDLDFGAVDVLFNSGQERAWVLEVNTCPGLDSGTRDLYLEAFLERAAEA